MGDFITANEALCNLSGWDRSCRSEWPIEIVIPPCDGHDPASYQERLENGDCEE